MRYRVGRREVVDTRDRVYHIVCSLCESDVQNCTKYDACYLLEYPLWALYPLMLKLVVVGGLRVTLPPHLGQTAFSESRTDGKAISLVS